jgi:predicted transcriptional regulator
MISRRTKVQIYLDILRSVKRAGGGLKKTHIVYKANLTHTRVQQYLDFLIEKEFLEEENKDGHIYYKITRKGLDFIGEANKLKEISDAFGLPLY